MEVLLQMISGLFSQLFDGITQFVGSTIGDDMVNKFVNKGKEGRVIAQFDAHGNPTGNNHRPMPKIARENYIPDLKPSATMDAPFQGLRNKVTAAVSDIVGTVTQTPENKLDARVTPANPARTENQERGAI